MVERYSHYVAEVFTEQRNLGVTLAEVVQHDELGVHLHADSDGLGGGAVRKHKAQSRRFYRVLSLKMYFTEFVNAYVSKGI